MLVHRAPLGGGGVLVHLDGEPVEANKKRPPRPALVELAIGDGGLDEAGGRLADRLAAVTKKNTSPLHFCLFFLDVFLRPPTTIEKL